MVFLGPVAQNLINGMAAKKSPLKFDFVEGKSTLPEFGFKDKGRKKSQLKFFITLRHNSLTFPWHLATLYVS